MKHPWIFLILGVLLSRKVDGFSCPGIGRYENEYDPKCQTYYLCGEAATLYKCPNGEVFDPTNKICSDAYTCSKPVFNCASAGHHANLGDTSCTSYYNCFNFFGFYFKFAQHCVAGEQFDPIARACSKTYDCGAYGLVLEEITTVPTTVPTTTTTQEIEVSKVGASALSAAFSSAATTAEFVCTAMGLFAEPNDPNCAIYYYCLPKTGGQFTRREYRCPTFFDPETKKCTDDYACATLVTSTISTTTTTTTTQTEAETTEATTAPAALVTNEVPLVGEPQAVEANDQTILLEGPPVPEALSGGVTNTTINKPLEEISTIVLDNPVTVSPEFECTATGRYPNTLDPTCAEYFLCSKLLNGTFLRTPYTCPASSFFDPGVRRCSKTFSCTPVETTTEYITTTTTTEAVMTTVVENEVTTESTTEFTCTKTGRYPDLSDFTCKEYFLCSKLSNGTFLKTPYSCPVSNFDPIIRICSKSYVCPYTTETTKETTETTVHTTETILETTTEGIWDFSCYKVGRFRNLNQPSCKSYFLCNQLRNGTFIQTEYDCPTTSIFDRSIHMCSTQISCM